MYACIHSPQAAALAAAFSPEVESIDQQTAVFSITLRQMGEIYKIPRIAVASTIDAAILAARNFPGVTVLPQGSEQRILSVLPIDALPPDPDIFETLDLWGIHTLGDFARLPVSGIAERLGAHGLWLQKLARGAVDRPLKPSPLETIYEESAEFDHPLELLEPLMFLIGRFLHGLCARLDSQSLSAASIAITLNRTPRTLQLPFPTRDVKFLLKLIQHELEAHKPDAPIERIVFRILPTDPRRIQHGLFVPAAPEPEKLELTLDKIRALVGRKNVKIPELRDTYRPGWSISDSHLALRYFRPPLAAEVETERGVPKHLSTNVCRGKIVRIAGPWRSSGDWWRQDQWNRDEWDTALADGGLYRIFHAQKEWFLEGSYD
jgi:protein ImuB